VIAVGDQNAAVKKESTFAWLPEAVRFYEDDRLEKSQVKELIEKEIVKNISAKEMSFVESVNGASYAVAYTAALESSLDDEQIIQRYGLLPGNTQIPTDDANIEKGSLIIYVFNTRTDSVIWRSAAQVGVHFDMTDEQRKERVERIVAEMFQTFPVQE
jgi:cytochrome c-type biogenesis protein CcmE